MAPTPQMLAEKLEKSPMSHVKKVRKSLDCFSRLIVYVSCGERTIPVKGSGTNPRIKPVETLLSSELIFGIIMGLRTTYLRATKIAYCGILCFTKALCQMQIGE